MTDTPRKIHLIGVCGTGMGGLAGLLKSSGHIVTGSDADTYPPMSEILESLGVPVARGFAADNLDAAEPDLVVVGNAVNAEVRAARERGLEIISLPEALARFILADRKPIVVAGTHGKTTTTALLAWILHCAGRRPGFLIGGAPGNFDAGFGLGAGADFVIEGDEFRASPWDPRPKFLHYGAAVALIHNIEFDHADRYADLDHVKSAFRDLVRTLSGEAMLAAFWDSPQVREVVAEAACRVVSYALDGPADWRAADVRSLPAGTEFSLLRGRKRWARLFVPLFGEHNVQNALGASVVAAELGVHADEIRPALASFKGVRRRQELVVQVNGIAIVDDFAHHPTAVKATIAGVRLAYPGRRLWAVFEPQTYTSRTNLLQVELIEALSSADRVLVLEPAPLDMLTAEERLSVRVVVDALLARGVSARVAADTNAVLERLAEEARGGDVVLLLSPGAFGGLRQRLPVALQSSGGGASHIAPAPPSAGRAGALARAEPDFIHRAFEAQVEAGPKRVALFDSAETVSYADLNARANRLAHHLRSLGAGPGARIGVMLRRSAEATVALLAVLKTGAAFVPLDPSFPRDRLGFMCRDSGVICLVTRRRELASAPRSRVQRVLLDDGSALAGLSAENPDVRLAADGIAFVVYTSGSTGLPNGVMGTHAALMNRFRWMYRRYPFRPDEVACQRTPLSFVDSVWETFGPLCGGIPTCIVPDGVSTDPDRLIELLGSRSVTRLVLVPSLLDALLSVRPDLPSRLPALTHWTLSGEAFPRSLAERLRAGRRDVEPSLTVLNLYGSTEVAADATCYEVRGDETGAIVPIGRPIDGVTAYALDERRRRVADGEPGELYIGGTCVSPGYVGRPQLSRERFLPDPFAAQPGARMFKSGDRVRAGGERGLEYLGRLDDQVKVRGVRIELGEVEAALVAHPRIRGAAAALQQDGHGGSRLVAFVVPDGACPPEAELRESLRSRLPAAAIPARVVTVAALPKLPSGKIDRAALSREPLPVGRVGVTREAAAPDRDDGEEDAVEQRLAGFLADALRLDHVEPTDDFFELGGDSLAAFHVVMAIEAELGISIPPGRLIEAPTPRALAQSLRSVAAASALIPIQPQGSRPPIFFFPGLTGDVLAYRGLALALGWDQPSFGLPPPGLDFSDGRPPRIADLAAASIVRMRALQPIGPYYLCGHSAAATTAFEAARQLREAGHEVGLLAVLDHSAPGSSYDSLRGLLTPRRLATLVGETLPFRSRRFLRMPRHEKLPMLKYIVRNGAWTTGHQMRLLLRGRGHGRPSPGTPPWFREMLRKMPEHQRTGALRHREALARYAPTAYQGRVTLFRVRGHPVFSSQDPEKGWRPLAHGGVDVVIVPGGHGSLMRTPAVEHLAAEIRARIPDRGGGPGQV
jgi:UDP-N-acetylmuramate:L-alanyl-gamma-D-glutamyl-meso-diaminopimelate ligase